MTNLPLSQCCVFHGEPSVTMSPLDDIWEWPSGKPVNQTHDLQAGAHFVILIHQLAPKAIHHCEDRS